jgi:hypothetical protein
MTRGGSGAHRARAAALTPAHALGGRPSRRRAGSGQIHSIPLHHEIHEIDASNQKTRGAAPPLPGRPTHRRPACPARCPRRPRAPTRRCPAGLARRQPPRPHCCPATPRIYTVDLRRRPPRPCCTADLRTWPPLRPWILRLLLASRGREGRGNNGEGEEGRGQRWRWWRPSAGLANWCGRRGCERS